MGGTWKKVSGDLTRQIDQDDLPMMGKMWPPEAVAKNMSTSVYGNIFALNESPLKQGMIYAGTDDGLIWITENDGGDWTKFDKFPGVPEMTFVNYVLPSRHVEGTVYACFDGRKNSSDFTPYLIKSTDKGKTWTSIASNLPSGTVYCIQEDHIDPNILFIGTEWGVWTSIDGGNKWVQLKKGLPTIQVKDLTIQERENDLVVATFGRGFYVLDDYSALRNLSKENANKEGHIFDIADALLYFPASNLSYQGAVHFRAKNPDPAAYFNYYVKTGYETLKQKRVKRMKNEEKSGAPFRYPTDEELLAERMEVKTGLVFTIYDANGEIMRKLNAPLRSGYNSISWDLSYLNRMGPKVPPGTYSIAIDKFIGTEFTRLAEPKEFKVVSMPNALGTPNYNSNFDFLKNLAKLYVNITAAQGKIGHVNKQMDNMKSILSSTAVEADVLVDKLDALKKELDAITKAISGGFGAKNSVGSRARFAMFANSRAQVDITGAQKEQYILAKDVFDVESPKLNAIYNTKLPALIKEFEAIGGVLYNNDQRGRRFFEE